MKSHINNPFFFKLLEENRFLSVLYDNLSEEIKSSELYLFIKNYINKYIVFNNITTEELIESYTKFIKTYNKHCKQFLKTNKYPKENGENNRSIGRKEYDIVLLLSVLFTPHRYRIMQLLWERRNTTFKKSLFIGLGPGLELALAKNNLNEIHTYDLSASDFLFSEFPDIEINKELYTGQHKNLFDIIYMIELIEHVSDPYSLIKICYDSLQDSGQLILTTATNIPQFDHLYNFPLDHTYFESQLREIGFSILNKESIPHKYITLDINSYNHFYILEK